MSKSCRYRTLYLLLLVVWTDCLANSPTAGGTCPDNCDCLADIVKCSKLTSFPTKLRRTTKELFLKDMNATEIPAGIIQQFRYLETVEILQSRINVVRRCAFRGARNMKKIAIIDSHIGRLEDQAFSDIANISGISIVSSSVDVFQTGSFTRITNISNLELHKIRAGTVESGAFTSIRGVEKLDISTNTFELVETLAFDNLRNVTKLQMEFNRIYDLKCNAFGDLFWNIQTKSVFLNNFECLCNLITDEQNMSYIAMPKAYRNSFVMENMCFFPGNRFNEFFLFDLKGGVSTCKSKSADNCSTYTRAVMSHNETCPESPFPGSTSAPSLRKRGDNSTVAYIRGAKTVSKSEESFPLASSQSTRGFELAVTGRQGPETDRTPTATVASIETGKFRAIVSENFPSPSPTGRSAPTANAAVNESRRSSTAFSAPSGVVNGPSKTHSVLAVKGLSRKTESAVTKLHSRASTRAASDYFKRVQSTPTAHRDSGPGVYTGRTGSPKPTATRAVQRTRSPVSTGDAPTRTQTGRTRRPFKSPAREPTARTAAALFTTDRLNSRLESRVPTSAGHATEVTKQRTEDRATSVGKGDNSSANKVDRITSRMLLLMTLELVGIVLSVW